MLYDSPMIRATFKTIMPQTKLLFLDCDSTLSAIEGVDELALLKGEKAFADVKRLTDKAMAGQIAIGDIFSKRLKIIQPSRSDVDVVAQLYIEKIEPTASATIAAAKLRGWTVIILSGGFKEVIIPLAKYLKIEHIEAVGLQFDDNGNYAGFDKEAPTTHNGGKPEVIEQWLQKHTDAITVMVGDGISDLETDETVDLFIGFGGFVTRPAVEKASEHFVSSLDAILPLLDTIDDSTI